MANTSASGGFLTPSATPAPLEDDALQDFLQTWLVGITGIDPTLVRPRWQPEEPNLPPYGTTWIAFGVVDRDPDTFVALVHNPSGGGSDELRRHEILHLLASIYGPQAETVAGVLRDGLQVPQNLEYLSAANMGLVSSGHQRTVPELVKERWLRRIDLPIVVKRQVKRVYAVENLLGSEVVLDNEHYITNIQV